MTEMPLNVSLGGLQVLRNCYGFQAMLKHKRDSKLKMSSISISKTGPASAAPCTRHGTTRSN
jgi:hypothetical protein